MGITRYVDVNVFVYWLGRHPVFGETAYRWVKKVEDAPRGEYVTSSLTAYEVLVIISGLTGRSLKDRGSVGGIIDAMTHLKGLTVNPLKQEDFVRALDLMEAHDLDYEDSIHLATALRIGAEEMVSNDEDFDRAPLRRVF
ncbi:MAG: type II toxin-antitoxin system VapC family toxin [Candidatus Bathyarchaeia archaeon]